jgi:hypothetical protein
MIKNIDLNLNPKKNYNTTIWLKKKRSIQRLYKLLWSRNYKINLILWKNKVQIWFKISPNDTCYHTSLCILENKYLFEATIQNSENKNSPVLR